jgi:hypothetical protein
MSKIFTTQLNGVFQKIGNDEESLEDCARFLAQAIAGEGNIYVHGTKEMAGILAEVTEGLESNSAILPLYVNETMQDVSPVDRVLLFTRTTNDEDGLKLVKTLQQMEIEVACVTSGNADEGLFEMADVSINHFITRKLVPTEEGDRTGFPSLMSGLFIYHCLALNIKEILEDL